MILEFNPNTAINLLLVNDSMELDSGQEVANLVIKEKNGPKVTIAVEVQGSVKVYYKDGMYKCASQMPDELLKLFHEGGYSPDNEDLNVVENNWFEIYVTEENICMTTDVIDVANCSEAEILSIMLEFYLHYKNERDWMTHQNKQKTKKK